MTIPNLLSIFRLVLLPQIPKAWAEGLTAFALGLTILAFLVYLVKSRSFMWEHPVETEEHS